MSSTNTYPRPECPPYSWRGRSYRGTLIYVRDYCIANDVLADVPKGPLGFDMEWHPNFRKEENNEVAVIQLATHYTVWLIQISAMPAFPSRLRDILGSNEWVKAGVNITNDCLKLHNDFGVSTRNCVDLSLLARSVDNAYWKGKYTVPIGLSHLLETYEGFSLSKGDVRLSDWEQLLQYDQQEYAANDAHAGYVLYIHLNTLARVMPKAPSVKYYTFSVINGTLLDISGGEV
ncbi:hypothetical protein SERLA73DRAFT_176493 [Serpula lacrymans var. lacrymans S7.3]|uniref:3'-5' exonuclease n=2 Tax=Serpula lacrymans var. lacrymans TaxID=341189 RepID=F8PN25_SERL3|nr:uncharacterized protein SERLADRAFT_459372 [Serpula lacrymans var. lacrymans S7.9]EGO03007.1 hypothetical protein SERLA73DRAFT_176493 [Serpula lacrymans var. lacrymans S7.3]EGO28686.1 hypothetical protein SERLADRAFT_459372 [Serpula lacrymans var. lacrymans S7.9]